MPRVILDGLTKAFEGPGRATIRALSELNLQAEEGECLVLVGPSGSGKTTALRLIAGLESPTSGTIRIGHSIVNDVPPKMRDVAMVFQSPALYPHLSAYDNIALGLKLRKYPRAEVDTRVRRVAQMLEISEYLNSRPMELSGGQRQRVAIGRAVVRQASVLLLDEPLANVEPGLRARLRSDLALLRKEGRTTMIYVTHDHLDALTIGNRAAVLRQGLLQQVGEPRTVYQTPANLFVAGFIGSPPMNFFPGTLSQRQSSIVFASGSPITDSSLSTIIDPSIFGLADSMLHQLQSALGKPVLLGLRPEHFQIGNGAHPKHWILKARIVSVENAGADQFLGASCPAGLFVARVPATVPIQPNQDCIFSVDPSQACFFDAVSGRALLQPCVF